MPMPKKHVITLSLGAGIQSTALAILLDREMLPGYPKPQWAIFSDTMAEPQHVYDTLDWLETIISYPIVRTSWGDLGANTWKAIRGEPVPERGHHQGGYIDLPLFSDKGLTSRQCTNVYKIRPIKAMIRELAQAKPPALICTQYLGISANEKKRAKPSRDKWITNSYPLVDLNWTRQDCQEFLDRECPGNVVRRSACYFCPFRSNEDWIDIKENYPERYEEVLEMERAMADHPRGPWFLRSGGLEKSMERIDRQREIQPALLLE